MTRWWYLQVLRLGAGAYFRTYAKPLLPIVIVAQPLAFAVITLGLAKDGGQALPQVGVGAAALAAWTVSLGAASWGLWLERRQGRLALVAAAPAPLSLFFAGFLAAAVTFALGGVVVALVLAPLLFTPSLDALGDPRLLIGIVAFFVSMLLAALLLMPLFAASNSLPFWFDALIYPMAILGGFFTSIDRLPNFVEPLAFVLAPHWGVLVLKRSFDSGADILGPLLWLALLAVAYLALARLLVVRVERRIRQSGSIPLV
jgi:ABC-2 type transport system permease protein